MTAWPVADALRPGDVVTVRPVGAGLQAAFATERPALSARATESAVEGTARLGARPLAGAVVDDAGRRAPIDVTDGSFRLAGAAAAVTWTAATPGAAWHVRTAVAPAPAAPSPAAPRRRRRPRRRPRPPPPRPRSTPPARSRPSRPSLPRSPRRRRRRARPEPAALVSRPSATCPRTWLTGTRPAFLGMTAAAAEACLGRPVSRHGAVRRYAAGCRSKLRDGRVAALVLDARGWTSAGGGLAVGAPVRSVRAALPRTGGAPRRAARRAAARRGRVADVRDHGSRRARAADRGPRRGPSAARPPRPRAARAGVVSRAGGEATPGRPAARGPAPAGARSPPERSSRWRSLPGRSPAVLPSRPPPPPQPPRRPPRPASIRPPSARAPACADPRLLSRSAWIPDRPRAAPPRVRAETNAGTHDHDLPRPPRRAASRGARHSPRLGHAWDARHLDDAGRRAYLRDRGARAPCGGRARSAPTTARARADFAEVFARCHAASPEFRSRLAPPPPDACAALPPAARGHGMRRAASSPPRARGGGRGAAPHRRARRRRTAAADDPHAGVGTVDPAELGRVPRAAEATSASRPQAALAAEGRRLFDSTTVAKAGESCGGCHIGGGGTNPDLGTIVHPQKEGDFTGPRRSLPVGRGRHRRTAGQARSRSGPLRRRDDRVALQGRRQAVPRRRPAGRSPRSWPTWIPSSRRSARSTRARCRPRPAAGRPLPGQGRVHGCHSGPLPDGQRAARHARPGRSRTATRTRGRRRAGRCAARSTRRRCGICATPHRICTTDPSRHCATWSSSMTSAPRSRRLKLTNQEIEDLVAYLQTL